MMLVLLASAWALTLEEAVARAESVNPAALVATLEAQRARLDAAEAYASLGLTPQLAMSRTWSGGAAVTSSSFGVHVGVLDASAWLNGAQRSAEAAAAKYAAEGTALDAQYSAALLFVSAVVGERAVAAREATVSAAEGTAAAVAVRVKAGLDSELLGRRAEAAVLVARAERLRAIAEARIARIRLQRALELGELGTLEAPAPLSLPGGAEGSPWLRVASQNIRAAEMNHLEDLAGILPTGGLAATTPLDGLAWSVKLSATWQWAGVIGPFLQERRSALATRIAETQLDALKKDLDAELEASVQAARAAREVRSAHEAREALAVAALSIGSVRLGAGLASSLEVLLLQDELASARAASVAAELEEHAAILESRRLAGLAW